MIEIFLKFAPKGPINIIPALVQIGRRQAIIWTNDGQFTDAYMQHWASMNQQNLSSGIIFLNAEISLIDCLSNGFYVMILHFQKSIYNHP